MGAADTAREGLRSIGWNGIQFKCPAGWEVIADSAGHLLIEEEFSPLLELRWERGKIPGLEELVHRISTTDPKQTPPVPVSPPPPLAALGLSGLTCLSRRPDSWPEILLWQCTDCATLMLVQLHQHAHATRDGVLAMLASLRCHVSPDEQSLWSLQDFRLVLPPGYQFCDSTFQPGLSRLAFTGNDLNLQFCRLAPAATRLRGHGIRDILDELTGSPFVPTYLADTEDMCECVMGATGLARVLVTLTRKPRCCWARMWHIPLHDRLLALVITSRRPIDPRIGDTLARCYETVPLR